MHEFSLCNSVMRIIERQAAVAGFVRVNSVRLEIGALANVEIEALRFSFAATSRGTIAHGARLEIIETSAHAWCPECASEVIIKSRIEDCPVCAARVINLRGGDMLNIKDMEVE